jgi:hypothetical protein
MNDGERRNIWDDTEINHTPSPHYTMLSTVISFAGFEFISHGSHSFAEQEKTILQPRLEELGYTDIRWFEGETDSFGPLTRRCRAVNPDGDTVWFMYG